MEQEPQASSKDEIDEKIRRTNIKSVAGAVTGSVIAGILAIIFNPFSDPFFGIIPTLGMLTLIVLATFTIIYQTLFAWMAKELVFTAMKRKKYVTRRLRRFFRYRDDKFSPFPENNVVLDPKFRNLPCNIYNEDRHSSSHKH